MKLVSIQKPRDVCAETLYLHFDKCVAIEPIEIKKIRLRNIDSHVYRAHRIFSVRNNNFVV